MAGRQGPLPASTLDNTGPHAGSTPLITMLQEPKDQLWNGEAAEIIDNAMKTQKEVADYLRFNTEATRDIDALKAECDEEVTHISHLIRH